MAGAGSAGRRFRAGLRAGARTGFASDRGRYLQRRGLADERFFERDLEIVAQVRAALAPAVRTPRPPAHDVAEQVLENVGHAAEAVARPLAAALLERGVAIAVVGGPLLPVGEMLVGFVDFLELDLGGLVARIAVGVKLHRRFAERRLQFGFGRGLGDAEDFVIVALGHFPPLSHTRKVGIGAPKAPAQ